MAKEENPRFLLLLLSKVHICQFLLTNARTLSIIAIKHEQIKGFILRDKKDNRSTIILLTESAQIDIDNKLGVSYIKHIRIKIVEIVKKKKKDK